MGKSFKFYESAEGLRKNKDLKNKKAKRQKEKHQLKQNRFDVFEEVDNFEKF
jgi:hypothetical protein